jgi:LuxR family maltose regulon positive regulatory protein
VVKRWLEILPESVVFERADLLFGKAWICYTQLQLERVPDILARIESLPKSSKPDETHPGQLAFYKGILSYWGGYAKDSVRLLEESLQYFTGTRLFFEGQAELTLAMARCMTGEHELARRELEKRIRAANTKEGPYFGLLIGGLLFVHMFAGNLHLTRSDGNRLLRVAKRKPIPNIEGWAEWLTACACLHTYELDDALHHFSQAAQQRYIFWPRPALDSLAGLALTKRLLGLEVEALESVNQMWEFARELNDPALIAVAESFDCRFALLNGELDRAVTWAKTISEDPVPAEIWAWFEVPAITLARVLIKKGSESSLVKAEELLSQLRHISEGHYFVNQTIEIGVLEALTQQKLGRSEEALTVLEEVVLLAQPGSWIRPFIEAGSTIAELLERLLEKNVAKDYIEKILAGFEKYTSIKSKQTFTTPSATPEIVSTKIPLGEIESLTHRELEVLTHLSRGYRNKEIATELFLSTETVKRHLYNIFQKLNVSSRMEAIAKSQDLGILRQEQVT